MKDRASCVLATSAAFAFAAACSLEDLDARSRFIEDTVGKQADTDWSGERVVIDVAAAGIGGIEVRAAPETKRVIATATLVAAADTEDKTSADLSIADVKGTFVVVTKNGTTTVQCPNGKDHQSSKGADSGCEKVVVSIPPGDPQRPLKLTVKVQRGALLVSTAGAFLVDADVSTVDGDIDAAIPATKGGTVSLTSESAGTVTVRLASDFSADKVVLDAAQGKVDVAAVPGIANGQGRGTPGVGLASLALASKPKDGRGGRLLVVPQQ